MEKGFANPQVRAASDATCVLSDDFVNELGRFVTSELGQDTQEVTTSCVFCKVPFQNTRHTTRGKCEIKVLRCLHSACGRCLEDSLGDGGQVKCPICDAPAGGNVYTQYLCNFAVHQGIDQRAIEEHKIIACDDCVEALPAVVYCDTCVRSLCLECSDHHRRARTTAAHHLVPLKEQRQQTYHRAAFCPIHLDSFVEFFCETCQTLCCRECIKAEHESHDYKLPVGGLVERQRMLVRELIQDLRGLAKQLQERHLALTTVIKEFDEETDRARTGLQSLQDEMALDIQSRRQLYLQKLDSYITWHRQACDRKRSALTSATVSMWGAIDFVEKVLSRGTDTEVLFLKSCIQAHSVLSEDFVGVAKSEALTPPDNVEWKPGDVAGVLSALSSVGGVTLCPAAKAGETTDGQLAPARVQRGSFPVKGDHSSDASSADSSSDSSGDPAGAIDTDISGVATCTTEKVAQAAASLQSAGGCEGDAAAGCATDGSSKLRSATLAAFGGHGRASRNPVAATGSSEGGTSGIRRPSRLPRHRSFGPPGNLVGTNAKDSLTLVDDEATHHCGDDAGRFSAAGDSSANRSSSGRPEQKRVLALEEALEFPEPAQRQGRQRITLDAALPHAKGHGGGKGAGCAGAVAGKPRKGRAKGGRVARGQRAPTTISLDATVVRSSPQVAHFTHMACQASPAHCAPTAVLVEQSAPRSIPKPLPRPREVGVHALSTEAIARCGLGGLKTTLGGEGDAPGLFKSPCGVAVDSGHIYVADTLNHRIQVFDRHTRHLLGIARLRDGLGELRDPSGLCLLEERRLALAAYGMDKLFIMRLTPNSLEFTDIVELGQECQLYGPFGVGCSQGRVVLADSCNHRCIVLDVFGSEMLRFGSQGSELGEFEFPDCIACFSDGSIAVSDKDNHRIQVFDAHGRFSHVIPADWTPSAATPAHHSPTPPGRLRRPMGMCSDMHDRIYVCDCGNNRVQVFTRDGRWLWSSDCDREIYEFNSPTAMAIDEDGVVYIASDHCVQIF